MGEMIVADIVPVPAHRPDCAPAAVVAADLGIGRVADAEMVDPEGQNQPLERCQQGRAVLLPVQMFDQRGPGIGKQHRTQPCGVVNHARWLQQATDARNRRIP